MWYYYHYRYRFPRIVRLSFLILWWVGVLGLVSWIRFLRLGVSVDGVLGLWCGLFGVFGVWALYINIKE